MKEMKGRDAVMETTYFFFKNLSILLILLIALIQMHGYEACLESERRALLELKSFFVSASDAEFADEILTSWADDDDDPKLSDCCDWERVKCNTTTRRVMQLSLNYTRRLNLYNDFDVPYLNLSLFHPFEELQSLDLSFNDFQGVYENKAATDSFGSLKQLKILNMSNNYFNDSILPYLNSLTSLTTLILRNTEIEFFKPEQRLKNLRNLEVLDLSWNPLTSLGLLNLTNLKSLLISNCGITTIEGITNLRNLQVLDLSLNSITSGFIKELGLANLTNLKTLQISDCGITTLQGLDKLKSLQLLDLSSNEISFSLESQGIFGNLTNLKDLDLSRNYLNGSIVTWLGLDRLKNLETLSLRGNNAIGTLESEGICGWKNLTQMDLRGNNFEGHLPLCLNNLTRLKALAVSSNKLSGNLTSIDAISTSLQYLDLSHNNFDGIFPLSLLANHSNLKVLLLSTANKMLEVKSENWIPTFQLKFLRLINCSLNVIPSFLLNQYDLEFLDLSHNKMVGNFPSWLVKNNTKLKVLFLSSNSFTGALQIPNNQYDLRRLDISRNNVSGMLPQNIGVMFQKMEYMDLSKNNFEGYIPSSIGEMKEVGLLDLSRNNFSGQLPTPFITGCVSLWLLDLSYNNFHGQIFSKHINFTRLGFLYLENNNFSEKIEEGLLKLNELLALDISNNMFFGHVPHWMGNFSSNLKFLFMSENDLEGNIPVNVLKFSIILDISKNRLSGCLIFSSNSTVRHLYLQNNALSGLIPSALFKSSNLMTLDLRDNKFSGRIPHKISKNSDLRVLLLKRNYLQGLIPNQLCRLGKLGILDLSSNQLNGSVPLCFSNVSHWRMRDDALYRDELEIYEITNGLMGDHDIYYHIGAGVIHTYFKTKFFDLFDPEEEHITFYQHVEVELMTKNRYEFYNGRNLNYMSGLDLSCNQLTGEIPPEIGRLQKIHALNLSHNLLTGSIPESFSNLKMIESLDLSHNKLSGKIPPQLIDLNFLSNFNVSYNNLSGPTPDKGQFSTFDDSSYRGNLDLCGSQIRRKCSGALTPTAEPAGGEIKEDESAIDMVALKWSFGASYLTVILSMLMVFWINSYWRRLWFYFIEGCIDTCYYWVFKHVFYR